VTATSTDTQSGATFTFTEQQNSNDATATGTFEAGAAASVSAGDVTVEAASSGQQFTVDVTDSNGNPVDGETVAITANSDGLAGITTSDTETTTDGTATFSFGESAAGTYTVEVGLDSDNSVSDTLTVTVGPTDANSVDINTEPDGTQTAGETLTGPPEVLVTDEFGNPVQGVSVSVSEDGGYSFDSGSETQTTGADGVATFDDLVIQDANTGYQLNFDISSADGNVVADNSASSQTFDVEAAGAASVSVNGDTTTATADGSSELQYTATVTDEFGNAVQGVEVVTTEDGTNIDLGGDGSLTTDSSGQVVVTATSTDTQSGVTFTFTEQSNTNSDTATGTFN
jgi:hypothetical protein